MHKTLEQKALLSFLTPGAIRLEQGQTVKIEDQHTGDFVVVRGIEGDRVELVDSSIPGYQRNDLANRVAGPA